MNVKKIVGILAIALVIFFVISNPPGAAGFLGGIVDFLRTSATAIISFFTSVFS